MSFPYFNQYLELLVLNSCLVVVFVDFGETAAGACCWSEAVTYVAQPTSGGRVKCKVNPYRNGWCEFCLGLSRTWVGWSMIQTSSRNFRYKYTNQTI